MKVEVKENHIWLYGENEEEHRFLEVLDKCGIKVFARSSTGIAITHPHELRQLFINREQQAILSYTLGIMEMTLLAKGLQDATTQDLLAIKDTLQISRDVSDLKKQLFVRPRPILAKAHPPQMTYSAKKKSKDKEKVTK